MGQIQGWLSGSGRKAFYGQIEWNNGIITAMEPLPSPQEPRPGDTVITAGKFNAHSHPEQSIYTDLVDPSWDLGTWCRNTIYKYSVCMTPRRVYLACLRAFSRMALCGTSSVMVSYYLHGRAGNELDREVIRAARDIGIRLLFGRMNYDIISEDAYEAKKESQKCYYETISEAEKNLCELMSEESDTITVAPALHSMHASTAPAIAHGLRLGLELGRPVQFHLSEDQGDVALSLKEHGVRPMAFLSGLKERGEVMSLSHLVCSDCCWLDDEERRLMAANGVRAVLDLRMNAHVKAGFPDVKALLDAGIPMWLGTDGEASNDSLDVADEKEYLHQRLGGEIAASQLSSIGAGVFRLGKAGVGVLKPGAWADFQVREFDGAKAGALSGLYVGGKKIVSAEKLTGLDPERDIEEPLREEITRMTAEKA